MSGLDSAAFIERRELAMSKGMIIVLATSNEGKIREFKRILKDGPLELKGIKEFGPIPEVIEDGRTFDDNAYKKAYSVASSLGLPAIADDSGLVVPALGGAPGVKSARYAGEQASDADNIEKLLKALKDKDDRQASFECVISIAMPNGPALTYEGRCEGEITMAPRGVDGFGYDPVFKYPPLGKTFAELTLEEKNRVSHRGKALQEVAEELDMIMKWLEARIKAAAPPSHHHK